jgi:hypothetical protein
MIISIIFFVSSRFKMGIYLARYSSRIVAFTAKGIGIKPTINDDSIVWIDRMDAIPKEREIYSFLLKDFNNSIKVKRLIKIDRYFLIIDDGNKDKDDRKIRRSKRFPDGIEPERAYCRGYFSSENKRNFCIK